MAFPKVNALLAAQRQLAAANWAGKVDGGKRSAHVSGPVVVALDRVRGGQVTVWDKTGDGKGGGKLVG